MNSKLLKASLAGVAAIGLAAGGGTFAALSDYGNLNNNSVGAGFLKLDLNAGHGSTALDFDRLAPGMNQFRTIWVASNDGQSVPSANLAITFKNLVDTAAPCSTSLGKAKADDGCTVSTDGLDTIGGTPTAGHLSQMLTFQTQYYPQITDPQTCQATLATSYPTYNSILPADHPGDMYESATAATSYTLKNAANTAPLVLTPGQGVCIGIGAFWALSSTYPLGVPNHTNPAYPVDNAAQADSMAFDVHFDLTQVM